VRPSETLTQALLDGIDVPLYVVDRDLRLVYLNRSYERLHRVLNVKLESPIGKSLFEIVPFLPETVADEFERVFDSGVTLTSKQIREIGEVSIVVKLHRFPILDGGRVAYVASTVTDITELENSQNALKESEETARALMNSSMESMFLMSSDGKVITANETAARRLGYTVEMLIGKSGLEMFGPEMWRRRQEQMEEAAARGDVIRVRDSRGELEFDASICPILDETGTVQRFAVCGRDISDLVEAMTALRQSEERFRRQFRYGPVPAYVWEQSGDEFILRDYNRGAELITRNGIGSYVGRTASEMYGGVPEIMESLRRCAGEQTSQVHEMQYRFRSTSEVRYLQIHYVYSPPNNVLVYTVDLTEQKAAEKVLQKSRDELERRVIERTEELAQANEQLNAERETLQQKNIALKELLAQVDENRKIVAAQLQSNVERIVLPIIEHLEESLDQRSAYYLSLLKRSLLDVVSPFMSRLETQSRRLTPRELEICNLIRHGFSSKEIAVMRNSSVLTVLSQRKIIRRKLGLAEKKVNLTTYLMSLGEAETDTEPTD
jgi:PAS domain S-box-containing protein